MEIVNFFSQYIIICTLRCQMSCITLHRIVDGVVGDEV